MFRRTLLAVSTVAALLFAVVLAAQLVPSRNDVVAVSRGNAQTAGFDRVITTNNSRLISQGRQTFRYETFGDEAFWGTRSTFIRPSPARRMAAWDRAFLRKQRLPSG